MKKILMLLVVAILLAGGLILASCEEKSNCPGDGDCKAGLSLDDLANMKVCENVTEDGGCMFSQYEAGKTSWTCDC